MKFNLSVSAIQLALCLVLLHDQVAGRALPGHPGGDGNVVAYNGHHHDELHLSTRDINVLAERAPPKPPVKQKSLPLPKKKVTTPPPPPKKKVTTPPPPPKKKVTTPPPPKKKVTTPPPSTKPKKSCPLPQKQGPKKQPVPGRRVTGRNIWYALTRRVPSDPPGTTPKIGDDTCPTQSTKFTLDCAVDNVDAELDTKVTDLQANDHIEPDAGDGQAESEIGDINDIRTVDIDDDDFADAFELLFKQWDEEPEPQNVAKKSKKYKRAVKFKCTAKKGEIDLELVPPEYPTPTEIYRGAAEYKTRLTGGWWVDEERMGPDDKCDAVLMTKDKKWGLSDAVKKEAMWNAIGTRLRDFHTEHVYEINFIPAFFTYLMQTKNVACEDIVKFFFTRPRVLGANARGGYRFSLAARLMDHLPSEVNMDELTVLDKDVNMLKYKVLHKGTINIFNQAKFKAVDLNQKITTFRRLLQVLEYMKAARTPLMRSKTYIEGELTRFDKVLVRWESSSSKAKANNPFSGFKLATAHHEFLNDILTKANTKAVTALKAMYMSIMADETAKKEEWAKMPAEVIKKLNELKPVLSKSTGTVRAVVNELELFP